MYRMYIHVYVMLDGVYIWVSVTLTGEGDTPYIKLFGCRERGYLNLAAKVAWPDQKLTREPHTHIL